MNGPPEKQELLAREKRLIRPVGIITLVAVAVFVASVIITSGAGDAPEQGDQSQLLEQYYEHSGQLMLGDVLGGIAFLLFSAPLYLLFNGARARADRVRRALVALAFIGPVLLGIQGPIQSVALKQAADDFHQELPALEAEQAKADAPAASDQAQAGDSGGAQQDQGGDGGGKAAGGEVTTTPTEQGAETTSTSTDTTSEDSSSDEGDDDAVEQGAEDAIKDNGTATFAQALLFPAVLGLVIGMVYISLWAMRTGLLTRFMGSLGMALGVALVLLPFAQLLLVLWFATIALMLLGRWPGGMPPAWEAGVAIPWLRPGDQQPGQDDTVEGEGREITPGAGPGAGEQAEDGPGPDGNGDGPPPRKRKRRR